MKKKLVVYLAGLLTVLGLGFGQAQFSDVPAGHWAKEAVERIAACGLITGFPDGTFRGNQNLTRYQAALIFQRLLNEIQQGGECVRGSGQGLSEEDLTAIRNALQELAAELAALGVRVSALEDNAATKDDIARLEAALEELKAMRAQPAEPAPGIDEAALADLADRVEAASVAADTALAQAQALAERLERVEGDVAALKTQLEADADSIRALNELAVLLNQDVLSLQDRVTAVEKQLAQLGERLGEINFDEFANREDVSAIQEFATALRADLVRLADRVSALDARVGGLDSRLAAVEGTRPTLTGNILARYGYRIQSGSPDFDIDRLFPATGFAQDSDGPDFTTQADSYFQTDLTFGIKRTPTTTTGFNLSEANATIRFSGGNGQIQVPGNTVAFRSAAVVGDVNGQPVAIRYNVNNTFRFTPYFMNNGSDPAGSGVVVTANLNKALLAPSFTIALGSTASATTQANAGDGDYFGIRGTVSLLGLNLGVNYAENNFVAGPANRRALAGLDLSGKLLGLLDLQLEGINSNNVATNTADTLFYAQAGLGLGPISLRANYRSIDTDFANGDWPGGANAAGLSRNDTDRIFNPASAGTGFGVIAGADLGFIRLNGYFDSKSNYSTLANPTTAFGVGAVLGPLAGFNVTGYFNSLTVGGTTTYSTTSPYSNQGPATRAAFGTNLGVRLAHDGAASSALIRGLNLAFEFRSSDGANAAFSSNGARTDLVGEASYALTLGPITITPNFRFHGYTAATTPGTEVNYTTLKYGVQLSTQPLFFGLSLNGAFAQRNTDFAAGTDASETLIRLGVSLADFLLPGATLAVDAAQLTGTGVGAFTTRAANTPFDTTVDRLFNGPSAGFGPVAPATGDGGVKGLQVRYTYAGWGVWWGVFDLDNNATDFATIENTVRAFRIFYTLNF
ncbi:S-layer homology domain-containing protein [Meiothermus sp. QL-1]|uniref:S-layer homology domain-containing protein n=1 Tax=Meiothermus sp. QL-1 TaxID=2058095 RepID=UPI001314CEC6|nr:S-layer homology domain-containing protein [Meiothermus sp. QL-1]